MHDKLLNSVFPSGAKFPKHNFAAAVSARRRPGRWQDGSGVIRQLLYTERWFSGRMQMYCSVAIPTARGIWITRSFCTSTQKPLEQSPRRWWVGISAIATAGAMVRVVGLGTVWSLLSEPDDVNALTGGGYVTYCLSG